MNQLTGLLLFLGAMTSAGAEMTIHRDLAYAEPKNERQILDVYSPHSGARGPVIVWIHGGGWQRGVEFPEGSDRELSSVLHIAREKGIPPFFILCVADYPQSGSALQSQILGHYLIQAGVSAQVMAVPGKTHATLNADLGLPGDEPTRALLEFVDHLTRTPP